MLIACDCATHIGRASTIVIGAANCGHWQPRIVQLLSHLRHGGGPGLGSIPCSISRAFAASAKLLAQFSLSSDVCTFSVGFFLMRSRFPRDFCRVRHPLCRRDWCVLPRRPLDLLSEMWAFARLAAFWLRTPRLHEFLGSLRSCIATPG